MCYNDLKVLDTATWTWKDIEVSLAWLIKQESDPATARSTSQTACDVAKEAGMSLRVLELVVKQATIPYESDPGLMGYENSPYSANGHVLAH